jgi:membrane-bound metal-dependent hydrolase YbcI (DUF457 family)
LFAHLGLTLASGRLSRRIALAYLALGSMLPDIIDKPLGLIVFGTPAMGRIFAHTLIFLLVLTALAVALLDFRIASISGGVLAHLVLDSMWKSPVTLLWPFLGNFPMTVELSTFSYVKQLLFELGDPSVLVPEVLGLSYLIYFAFERRSSLVGGLGSIVEGHRILRNISQMLFHDA